MRAWQEDFRLKYNQEEYQAAEQFCLFLFLYVGMEVSGGSWLTVQVALTAGTGSVWGALSASLVWIGLTAGRFGGSWTRAYVTPTPIKPPDPPGRP